MKALSLLLPLFALLAGCANGLAPLDSTKSYADGYNDGCSSGSSAASNMTGRQVRNEARYTSDPEYASGWRNGQRGCDGDNLRANPNNPMEQVDENSQLMGEGLWGN
jgi:hypothetical protein